MSEATVAAPAPAPTGHVLYRTENGGRLHIPGCPHIGGSLRESDAYERLAMQVCSWCRAEIDGVGRSYHDTLDDAMRALGCHVATQSRIREALKCVTFDQIWLPYSRSYIALGHEGRGVAWVGKTYVMPTPDAFIELPGFRDSAGGGPRTETRVGDTCPTHHITRSVTGVCELCE